MDMIDESRINPMSDGAFAHLGVENIAYIRPVDVENVKYFVLMSAQGHELVVAGNYDAALAAAYERGLIVAMLN